MLNYYEIGQRIRTARKANSLSQEKLAEQVSISITHMSHIETGDTKLSLQVLADIADALHVSTDTLIRGNGSEEMTSSTSNLAHVLKGCSPETADAIVVLADTIKKLAENAKLT